MTLPLRGEIFLFLRVGYPVVNGCFICLRGMGWAGCGGMEPDHAPTEADAYSDWILRRIGAEVRRRREALGLSAYALGKAGAVSDQTILNIEQGRCGALIATMARIAKRLGLSLTALVGAAEMRSQPE